MVRKLNISKCYQRLDNSNIEVVSNDEVEVDLLNVNSFMHIADILSEASSGDTDLRTLEVLCCPVTGANATLATENPIAQQNMSDTLWQQRVEGNVEPATTAATSLAKLSPIDFHGLGPIY